MMNVGKKRKMTDGLDMIAKSNYDLQILQKYQKVNKAIKIAFDALELAKDLVVDLGEDVQDELLMIAESELNFSAQTCDNALDYVEESRSRLNETNILDLPDLAMIELLKYLPLRDILRLRSVNNRLYIDVTRLHERCRVWMLSETKLWSNFPDEDFFQSSRVIDLGLFRSLSYDDHENIEFCYGCPSQIVDVLETNDCVDRVISLRATSQSIEQIPENLIQRLTGLESMLVNGARSNTEKSLPKTQILFDSNASSLKQAALIRINSTNSLHIHQDMPKLHGLRLSSVDDPQLVLDILTRGSTSLKYLTLRECDLQNLTELEKDLHLKSLVVINCTGDDGMKQLLVKCRSSLKYLLVNQYSSPKITHGFSVNCEMTALNELILASTSIGGEDDGLQNLLNCSPNLKYLWLNDCKIWTQEGFRPKLPKLEELKLTFTTLSWSYLHEAHTLLFAAQESLKYFVLKTPSFEKHQEDEDGVKDVQIFKWISKSGIEDFSEAKWYIPNMKKVTVDDKTGFVERRHFDGHVPDDATIEIIQQQ